MSYVIVAVLALLVGAALAIAAEETRVSEAHRNEKSWRKRTCRHMATRFQPYEGDDAARSRVGRRP